MRTKYLTSKEAKSIALSMINRSKMARMIGGGGDDDDINVLNALMKLPKDQINSIEKMVLKGDGPIVCHEQREKLCTRIYGLNIDEKMQIIRKMSNETLPEIISDAFYALCHHIDHTKEFRAIREFCSDLVEIITPKTEEELLKLHEANRKQLDALNMMLDSINIREYKFLKFLTWALDDIRAESYNPNEMVGSVIQELNENFDPPRQEFHHRDRWTIGNLLDFWNELSSVEANEIMRII